MRASIVSRYVLPATLLLLQGAVWLVPATADTGFVFTQELLLLVQRAVHLSDLAYSRDPLSDASLDYDSIVVFNDEPDQALVVSVDGYCMVGFRGTMILSWSDIYQNVELGNELVCNASNVCCNVERGFYKGYNTNYRTGLEEALRVCASTCTTTTTTTGSNATTVHCPPVVLTGHSQGGSIAATAALYLSDLSPTVITFGQPPAIDAPCELIHPENFYRFENSRVGWRGTCYEPVPYMPYDADQFGRQIMLGEDDTGVAYIGLNTEVEFRPYDAANGFASHRLEPDGVGYIHRIDSLVRANGWASIIRSSGFRDGTACSQNVECDSSICSNERCVR
jgi:Lipase (class 3)